MAEKVKPRGKPINVLDVVDPSFLDDDEYQRLIEAAARDAKRNGLTLLYELLTAETAS